MTKETLQLFILAIFSVFAGSLVRRARELDKMDHITPAKLVRMFGIELMMMPAFASLSAYAVLYYKLTPLAVLPVGIGAGLGGFATGTLLYEIWSAVVGRLGRSVGGSDG